MMSVDLDLLPKNNKAMLQVIRRRNPRISKWAQFLRSDTLELRDTDAPTTSLTADETQQAASAKQLRNIGLQVAANYRNVIRKLASTPAKRRKPGRARSSGRALLVARLVPTPR